jgi:hypothetical protein
MQIISGQVVKSFSLGISNEYLFSAEKFWAQEIQWSKINYDTNLVYSNPSNLLN